MIYDAIIIGGGAAGLFCAIEAGKRGLRALVIEHNSEVGRKIIISGGGRCNFTNIDASHENFISKNPHFCKSALTGYGPHDFVELVRRHQIEYYEKKSGQLFCRGTSRAIVEMLLKECVTAKVKVQTGCSVEKVQRKTAFEISTTHGSFSSPNLVIASGGLSFPKIGASDLGYRIATSFGIRIETTRPSLAALRFSSGRELTRLSGLSVDACVSSGKQSFRENILFTHRGLSGPAILQISNYWKKNEAVNVDLFPDADLVDILFENNGRKVRLDNFLSHLFPRQLAAAFAERLPNKPLNELSRKDIQAIGDMVNNWQVHFRETEGYDRAEVTLGGVSTSALSSKTMESKQVFGLYFIGEVVDVTGWLGGYNFQWAWSSGYAAGRALRK